MNKRCTKDCGKAVIMVVYYLVTFLVIGLIDSGICHDEEAEKNYATLQNKLKSAIDELFEEVSKSEYNTSNNAYGAIGHDAQSRIQWKSDDHKEIEGYIANYRPAGSDKLVAFANGKVWGFIVKVRDTVMKVKANDVQKNVFIGLALALLAQKAYEKAVKQAELDKVIKSGNACIPDLKEVEPKIVALLAEVGKSEHKNAAVFQAIAADAIARIQMNQQRTEITGCSANYRPTDPDAVADYANKKVWGYIVDCRDVKSTTNVNDENCQDFVGTALAELAEKSLQIAHVQSKSNPGILEKLTKDLREIKIAMQIPVGSAQKTVTPEGEMTEMKESLKVKETKAKNELMVVLGNKSKNSAVQHIFGAKQKSG